MPFEYTQTATNPLYGTLIPDAPTIGGNTYTQTRGLLGLLEDSERAAEFEKQVQVQVAATQVAQQQQQQKRKLPTALSNTDVIILVLVGLFVGYIAYPIIQKMT